ncbi:hypothetical protein J19TS1_22800 [Heyndrickxia oleronia]|nr:hypothetical protein J19TS1_22800 [Heyndrickxia oleronia]
MESSNTAGCFGDTAIILSKSAPKTMQGVRGGSSTIDFPAFSINNTFVINIVEKPMIENN